jgi:hypothetical protein
VTSSPGCTTARASSAATAATSRTTAAASIAGCSHAAAAGVTLCGLRAGRRAVAADTLERWRAATARSRTLDIWQLALSGASASSARA